VPREELEEKSWQEEDGPWLATFCLGEQQRHEKILSQHEAHYVEDSFHR
jgi:hypothetical protein